MARIKPGRGEKDVAAGIVFPAAVQPWPTTRSRRRAGKQGLRATVCPTEGTGGKKRGSANSPGPREWSEGAAEAEVAMAGGMELSGARETSPTSHESPN